MKGYRAISRTIILLSGASAGGMEPHAFAPAVQSSSAMETGGRLPFTN